MILSWIKKRILLLFFTKKQQAEFLSILYQFTQANVTATKAIKFMADYSEDMVFGYISKQMYTKLSEGQTLSVAAEGLFNVQLLMVLSAGEETGHLKEGLDMATKLMTSSAEAVMIAFSSMLYPLTLLVLVLVIMIIFGNYLVETLPDISQQIEWNTEVMYFMNLITFLEHWGLWLLVGGVAFFMLMQVVFRVFSGVIRLHFDTLPGFDIYRQGVAMNVVSVFAILLAGQVNIKKVVNVLKRHATPYLIWHVDVMSVYLNHGCTNPAEILDTGLLQKQDIARLKLMAEAQNFERSLVSLAENLRDQREKKIKHRGKFIASILMLAAAFGIVFTYYTMFSISHSVMASGAKL